MYSLLGSCRLAVETETFPPLHSTSLPRPISSLSSFSSPDLDSRFSSCLVDLINLSHFFKAEDLSLSHFGNVSSEVGLSFQRASRSPILRLPLCASENAKQKASIPSVNNPSEAKSSDGALIGPSVVPSDGFHVGPSDGPAQGPALIITQINPDSAPISKGTGIVYFFQLLCPSP
ncbi:hypothetical protein Nepgr_027879 [Nepenthes gracilis]|uniref:Uncharacterized protein n=1 Tax=Nepenthes gracilis TaxID=150966 RepID=A0AAD3TBB4_NEPGR|nr:hypothetical protein Nepgr_027879 [Nepenthes gracilis]